MTYKQAFEAGYINGETALFRGYVSRKINPEEQPVKTAGGRKKGRLYVELPFPGSSQYSIRQYLIRSSQNE